MTSTPEEPTEQPEVAPAGDPGQGNAPQAEPDTLPDDQDAATGTDPEDAEQTVGPGVTD